jgi:hypothetical protein
VSPRKAAEPREVTIAEIEQKFELASYWFGVKWCPAVHVSSHGYGIRVIKSHGFSGSNRSYTYDYFELDPDGLITTAPRGYAKFFRPGRVPDLDKAVQRFAHPQPDAMRIGL